MITVKSIEPFDNGHKRRVQLIDTNTGDVFERIYGDSVSEATIRLMSPLTINSKRRSKRNVR
jgi:hypothetical protein